jgi:hypothetical protein
MPGFANRDEHCGCKPATPVHGDQTAIPPRTPPYSSLPLDADAALKPGALFVPSQPPLLPNPPIAPTNRWKTLAGVTGFSLRRSSLRIHSKKSIVAVAALA